MLFRIFTHYYNEKAIPIVLEWLEVFFETLHNN
jgi:hypothetical protein